MPLTRVTAFLQRPLQERWRYPADVEGAELAIQDTVFDDSPARTELGVEPAPFEQSARDTVRWLVEAGRLRPRYAGEALSTQA